MVAGNLYLDDVVLCMNRIDNESIAKHSCMEATLAMSVYSIYNILSYIEHVYDVFRTPY